MDTIILVLVTFVGYILAYRTYGRFLARKIFCLDPQAQMPSHVLLDNIDYVPTKKEILFGHHYTSIAGTGPIVGPAIGIIWGWLPALLWIFVGSIFMGALHDLGALVLSARNEGKSIGEVARNLINPRVRTLFFLIIFFGLLIVIAIFGLVIATLFELYPHSVLPVWLQIPIAFWLGHMVYTKQKNVRATAVVAVILMYATIVISSSVPLKLPALFGLQPLTLWVIILLVYAYIASVIPVWRLLQPRDYINAYQLFIALGLLILGVLVSRPRLVAPALQLSPEGAPPLLPLLFVTIACGAISGFHALVSSGTSSKQLKYEPDALPVGFGSMLTEGALAVLVIAAVAAGIGLGLRTAEGNILTGVEAWQFRYSSWTAASGLAAKVGAFVEGAANMLAAIGIPRSMGTTLMGVFVASFAGTTLDTATRIQRYVITELAADYKIKPLAHRHPATLLAVVSAGFLALVQGGGKGGLILWPLFGTTNQLLAGLTLLAITLYLFKQKKPCIYSAIPMVFMIVMTGWAMIANLQSFLANDQWHLVIIGVFIIMLEIWVLAETVLVFLAMKKNRDGVNLVT